MPGDVHRHVLADAAHSKILAVVQLLHSGIPVQDKRDLYDLLPAVQDRVWNSRPNSVRVQRLTPRWHPGYPRGLRNPGCQGRYRQARSHVGESREAAEYARRCPAAALPRPDVQRQ